MLAYSFYKNGIAGTVATVTAGAIKGTASAAAGVVVGVGKAVGIPQTNHDQCAIDMANGDNWGASLSCDMSTFLKWQSSGIKTNLDNLKNLL